MKQIKDMFSEYGDIVTVEEVMKMLQIGRVSVYQMLKSGEIRSRMSTSAQSIGW